MYVEWDLYKLTKKCIKIKWLRIINTVIRGVHGTHCVHSCTVVCLCKWSAELLKVLIAFTVPHVYIEYSSKTFLKTLHVLQLKLCSCSNETVIVCVTDIFTMENILATLNNGEWSGMSSLENNTLWVDKSYFLCNSQNWRH